MLPCHSALTTLSQHLLGVVGIIGTGSACPPERLDTHPPPSLHCQFVSAAGPTHPRNRASFMAKLWRSNVQSPKVYQLTTS